MNCLLLGLHEKLKKSQSHMGKAAYTIKQKGLKQNEEIRSTGLYHGFGISMCNSRVI